MSHRSPSTIVGPSATALADGLESIVGEELRLVAEYDPDGYGVLYASDRLLDDEGVVDDAGEIEELLPASHLDVLLCEGVSDVRWPGAVGTLVTYIDDGTVVWIRHEDDGVFVVLDGAASIDDVQVTIEKTLGDGRLRLPLYG